MRIERILSPVHSLGPGERVAVWTRGCTRRCKGCISAELWEAKGCDVPFEIYADAVASIADRTSCTGLTLSGGDPLEQADIVPFLKAVRHRFDDILVYTGYRIEDIERDPRLSECLEYADVLIDGEYAEERNTPDCVLRGSSNQRIIYLRSDLRPVYESYMEKGRIIEPFVTDRGNTILTGILNRENQT